MILDVVLDFWVSDPVYHYSPLIINNILLISP